MKNSGCYKNSIITFLFWLCIMVLKLTAMVFLLQNQKMEWRFVPELMATPVVDQSAVSGSCNDTPVSAFAPNAAYTISFVAPVATAPISTCSATVSLTGNVNGDTNPSVACSITDQNGFVVLSSRTFSTKIGGLACTTEDESNLQINGDGSDNTAIDIAILPVSETSWSNGQKVDHITSANKVTLFGTGGQVSGSMVVDGQDKDALTNGEVEFGGTLASTGGSKIFIRQDITNYDVQPGTDVETLTLTMTPQ